MAFHAGGNTSCGRGMRNYHSTNSGLIGLAGVGAKNWTGGHFYPGPIFARDLTPGIKRGSETARRGSIWSGKMLTRLLLLSAVALCRGEYLITGWVSFVHVSAIRESRRCPGTIDIIAPSIISMV